MKWITIIILFAASLTQANWRNHTDQRADSLAFSQFKYFSFYSDKVSGHIAYVQLSPEHLNRFYVLANVVVDGIQHTMFQPLSGNCARRNFLTTEVDVCGQSGILEETNQGMIIYNSSGKVRWNIQVEKSSQFGKLPQYDLPFSKTHWFEHLLNFDWSISWKPMDIAMQSTGSIYIGKQEIKISKLMTYHDDTWGNWNFLTQPYFWLYFADTTHKDRNMQLVIGDIYFNKADRFMGMTLNLDNETTRYRPEDYETEVLKIGSVGMLPINLFGRTESYQISDMIGLHAMKKRHNYASQVQIKTKDGRIKLLATVRTIAPYLAQMLGVNQLYGAVWHDDAVVDIKYWITDKSGQVIEGQQVGGMEFFVTEKIGIPLKF